MKNDNINQAKTNQVPSSNQNAVDGRTADQKQQGSTAKTPNKQGEQQTGKAVKSQTNDATGAKRGPGRPLNPESRSGKIRSYLTQNKGVARTEQVAYVMQQFGIPKKTAQVLISQHKN